MKFSVNTVIMYLSVLSILVLVLSSVVGLDRAPVGQRMSAEETGVFEAMRKAEDISQCIASINNSSPYWPDSLKEYASKAIKKCSEGDSMAPKIASH